MVLGGFDDSILSYEIVTIAYFVCVSYSKQYGRQRRFYHCHLSVHNLRDYTRWIEIK